MTSIGDPQQGPLFLFYPNGLIGFCLLGRVPVNQIHLLRILALTSNIYKPISQDKRRDYANSTKWAYVLLQSDGEQRMCCTMQ